MRTAPIAIHRAALQPRSVTTLNRLFAPFNSLHIVAYLPTLAGIQCSGHGDQSLLSAKLNFLGANLTRALWLREQNGRRINRVVAVNGFIALMCGTIAASIVWMRRSLQGAAFAHFL